MKFDGVRPIILVSKCIEIDSCRYNAQMVHNGFVKRLFEFVDFVCVCPEVEIGLGVPRKAISIFLDRDSSERFLIQRDSDLDCSKNMKDFCFKFVSGLEEIDGAILKGKSPSCGLYDVKVHDLDTKGFLKKEAGFFAEEVLKKFGDLPLEDENRLSNFEICEVWLFRVFTFARFRVALKNDNWGSLKEFFEKNFFVLFMFDSSCVEKLQVLIDSFKSDEKAKFFQDFSSLVVKSLNCDLKRENILVVLKRIFERFSSLVSYKEKLFFFEKLDLFKNGNVSLELVSSLLFEWAIRFDDEFLIKQTFFSVFPRELSSIKENFK